MEKWTFLLLALIALSPFGFSQTDAPKLNKQLEKYSVEIVQEFDDIPEERKQLLKELGDYVYQQRSENKPVNLTVICTHNSRRSHMGQLWLYTAAAWYGVPDVRVYSGGTEATAFNPRAIEALKRAGFKISKTPGIDNGTNPYYDAYLYRGKYSKTHMTMFSKKYTHSSNPRDQFAAIMVCSDADKSCPVVSGSNARIAIPFEDPKYSDDTPSESVEYDKTVRLMAREMFFAMNHAKERMIHDMESKK